MIHGEMKTSFDGLVRLLARNLYSKDDAFVRELVQNAHDSIVKRAHCSPNAPAGLIEIQADREARTITFEDNGSGMTTQELEDHLATIGRSGTGEFRASVAESDRKTAQDLIGQFGIGMLSAFVVGRRLVVETRSIQPGSVGLRWTNDSSKNYTIEEFDKAEPGTRVVIHLDEGKLYMADNDKLREALRRYADFIPERIFVGDVQANAQDAPWHKVFASAKDRQAAYEEFINRRFPDFPLETIPVDIDKPYVVRGVLYISDRHLPDINTAGAVDIYQARMFVVSQDRNLLPEWARFVRGVIDSPDLTPTAARDAVQQDKAHAVIKDLLGRVIIQRLQSLATTDRLRFERVMEWHHYHIKGMAVQFDDFFDEVADLVLFECNQQDDRVSVINRPGRNKLISMREYIERQRATGQVDNGRATVYFFKEQGAATQYYRLCLAKGLLVLSACAIFEEAFLKKYEKRRSAAIMLKRIDIAEGSDIFEPLPDADRLVYLDLEFYMSTWLRAAVPTQETTITTERFAPDAVPAVLTQTRENEAQEQIELLTEHAYLLGAFEKLSDHATGMQSRRLKPIHLHLNANNVLIQRLARSELAEKPVQQIVSGLYNNALLYSMHALSPESKEIVYDEFNHTLFELLEQQEKLAAVEKELKTRDQELHEVVQNRTIEKTAHPSIFVMMPFHPQYDGVEQALRLALETAPFFFQVFLARDNTILTELLPNVRAHMQRVHGFIAEISDDNPNVMFELGVVSGAFDDRPRVLLKQKGGASAAIDIRHWIYAEYEFPDGRDANAIQKCADHIQSHLMRTVQFAKLRSEVPFRFLSPIFLQQIGARLEKSEAEKLSRRFETIEFLLNSSDADIEAAGGLKLGFGRVVRASVENALAAQPSEIL